MAELKVKKIKTTDGQSHDIDAKYWNGHETLKSIGGNTLFGSGDIPVNVQAVDTGDVLDDVNANYATVAYVDGLIGDINSVLESIING